jgi:hypothetical protein
MCSTKVGTVRASFDIASDDLAQALILARREGITSASVYRRAIAEYLVNHGDPDWSADAWPVGDGIGTEVRGSAPTSIGQEVD